MRWSNEYLQRLQSLPKWKQRSPNLQPGDIVIIREDTHFTCHWPLARVLQTFPGQDGLVRVATVKTANSIFKRPVSKLALIHSEGQDQDIIQDLPAPRTDVFPWEDVQATSPSHGCKQAQVPQASSPASTTPATAGI